MNNIPPPRIYLLLVFCKHHNLLLVPIFLLIALETHHVDAFSLHNAATNSPKNEVGKSSSLLVRRIGRKAIVQRGLYKNDCYHWCTSRRGVVNHDEHVPPDDLSYQQHSASATNDGSEDSCSVNKTAGERNRKVTPRQLQKARRKNNSVIILLETLWGMMIRMLLLGSNVDDKEENKSFASSSSTITFIKTKHVVMLFNYLQSSEYRQLQDDKARSLHDACDKERKTTDDGSGVSLSCLHNRQRSCDRANFQPIQVEVERSQFTIKGEIPVDLNGLYVRNGPNRKAEYHRYHLFYGEGMVHGIWLKDGNAVKYKNQFVKLGTKNRLQSGYSNVAVVEHNSRLFSLGEFGPAYELCPKDLSTIGKYEFEGKVGPNISAHPKKDLNGKLHFFVYKIFTRPFLTYYCANQSGKVIATVPIELDEPKMIHDFMITEQYVIFMDLPMIFNDASALVIDSLLGKDKNTVPVTFKPDRVSRIGLMPKRGTQRDIRWFNIDTCYIFHTVNAYEKGNEVIFDVIKYKNMDLSDPLTNDTSHLTRYCLNILDGSSKEIMLDDEYVEFPQINPCKLGINYRYLYCSRCVKSTNTTPTRTDEIPPYNGLIKYDLIKKEAMHLTLPENMVMGEFSFVEKRNAKKEDDGYLLGYVYDRNKMTSCLMILDASKFCQDPLLATIDLGIRVPNGCHGTWVSNEGQ